MRLTHLKLAGFKSFVDPTTIHLHGQRVGVVGPNGCGKSNVMESVRWVLGESSAKEMRADAMDAVIFNGSGNRKPISRASVELIFDNSLGGAAGAWSQYAEISVKRVIEREKGSTYYINNSAVRRRDVADLFLGTGLGGRAYAIIGQNTISRIVEAKPEELRIFLEEAAGISKYKERRRETELRLRDTRENLTRVEDICRELQKQITKLESQAVVTQQYHALQATFKLAEGQLWLLKKRDASLNWEKAKLLVEQLVNQLEAQTAALRKSEAELELSRQAHYAASEGINTAQATYYEANAEVSNLENQVKQNTEARERMAQQLQQLAQSIARNTTNTEALQQDLVQLDHDLALAQSNEQESSAALASLKLTLPEKESLLNAATKLAQASHQALNEANQRIQVERNNIQFINQNIQENQQRIQRFEGDLDRLTMPNESDLYATEASLQQAQNLVVTIEKNLQSQRANETVLQAQLTQLRDSQNTAQRAINQADAEMHSLQKMQQSLHSESKLNDWLARAGLKESAYLWQKIKINADWRVAIESVLGAKLNALITNKNAFGSQSEQRPPSALVLGFDHQSEVKQLPHDANLTPLIQMIEECDAELKPVLVDWLQGTYLLLSEDATETVINKLQLGETLVNQHGDIFSRYSVSYHSTQSNLHGVLERQAQLDLLKQNQPSLLNNLSEIDALLKNIENQLQLVRQQQQYENAELRQATQHQHQMQLKLAQLQQVRQNALEREKSIQTDLAATKQKLAQLMGDKDNKQALQDATVAELNALDLAKNNDAIAKQQAEQAYFLSLEAIAQAEKNHQEFGFNLKLINNKINDLNNKLNAYFEEKIVIELQQKELEQTLLLTPMDTLKANLVEAINIKQNREASLARARDHLAEQEQVLQNHERARMQNEQQLHPLRDHLEQHRLNEQEARLTFEQCQAGLLENGQDEIVLAASLSEQAKVSDLVRKSNQIQQEINALGAVNLAAIQELNTETERKTYLDSQMLDLRQASDTLEDAIRKIDRETRDKLMHTFNTANQHFGELFATLFAGGQARLELLGDEILDTGLQVFAQPPGKKNTTIQLLSGGEKALTALALVFALFRLNPAPFCLMDEVDAPLDDSNTERFCHMVKKMSENTQFLFVSHNKITMEMAQQLIGVTMQESGVSRVVDVDIEAALTLQA
ncbi:MAG: chromosome segregation protein SMC [Methylotenera sp.]|nr:MAG: chromosome segregation protein SMC [Methylotenera sp.]